MKRLIVVLLALFFVTECGLLEGDGPLVSVEEYRMKGDFLFNKGARIVFTPICFYKKNEQRIQCGLSASGVETEFIRKYSLDGEKVYVRYNYYDKSDNKYYFEKQGYAYKSEYVKFDKLIVITEKDSSNNILQYVNFFCSSFSNEIVNGFYYDSTTKIGHAVIESDSLGIVDFVLKDAEGTKVHIKYDMSHLIQEVRDSAIVTADGIKFVYEQGNFQWYEMNDLESCFINPKKFSSLNDSNTYESNSVFIKNASIDQCISFCNSDSILQATSEDAVADDAKSLYDGSKLDQIHSKMTGCSSTGRIPIAYLPMGDRDSIIECDASIDIEDTSEIEYASIDDPLYSKERMSLWKLYKSFCKGVVIFSPQMADCTNDVWNLYYRYRDN